ncbi:MAG: extracellular solute-binding protein [Alphaproteobacteria bacterium]
MLRFFLLLCFLTSPTLAESPTPQFGISMHGAPKYAPTNTHLTYTNPNAPKGGNVTIAAIGTFDTINPFSIKGKAAQGLNLIYDRLMARVWDEPFTMYPLIAQSYEMPDDRSAITFHLNPAARFHDSTPITAADVLFSYKTLKESGRPNMRRVYRLVDTTKIKDNSITFTFDEGHDRETALILAMMPVLSKSYWQDKTFDSTTLDATNANGPYRIKSIDAGRSITYERVKDYWAADFLTNKGHHNFDQITYDYYRDDGVALEAFAAAEQDYRRENDIAKWSQNYDFPAIQNGTIIKKALPHSRPERTRGFIYNTRRAPFDDIRVRESLSLLLDRHKINQLLFNNQKQLINSYFPNSEFEAGTAPTQPRNIRTNMRKASALLKDAGYTVTNGKQTKDGAPLTFALLIKNPEDEKIALNFKQSLNRLGITMSIRITDSADFLRRIQGYDYDLVLHHWQSSLSPGTEQTLYWGCEAAEQKGRFNYAGICDPQIDALAAAVANTTTRESLVQTMQKLDAELLKGHYMIPLFHKGEDYIAHNKALKHPKETPLYGTVFETWWMEQRDNTKKD